MKYANLKSRKEAEFRNVTGVSPPTFNEMVRVLRLAYLERHKKLGRHRKLCIEDMLLATLEYYKEYRTYESIAVSYGLTKPNIYKTIKWVEETLVKSGLFTLPGKKSLAKSDVEFSVVVVDTTEAPIQRPQKGQSKFYSGKKNDIQ